MSREFYEKAKEFLLPAYRQYRHNDNSGLIQGFEYEETIELVASLMATIDSYGWKPIEYAPKDGRPILGWCNHDADPYYLGNGVFLTTYGAHAEGICRGHANDGFNIVQWGGGYTDGSFEEGYTKIPDWWFVYGTDFELVANPTHYLDYSLILPPVYK